MYRILTKCIAPILISLSVGQARAAAPVYSVLDYGAKNDGSASATEAFRTAIQAVKSAGGGTVTVPPGRYITGPIELVSNLTFHIEAGATLVFQAQQNMP